MNGESFYKKMLHDHNAVYFTKENFDIRNDGTMDVSSQLQDAVYSVVKRQGYGVLFVPEGKYLISKTIYIPKAVRIILSPCLNFPSHSDKHKGIDAALVFPNFSIFITTFSGAILIRPAMASIIRALAW